MGKEKGKCSKKGIENGREEGGKSVCVVGGGGKVGGGKRENRLETFSEQINRRGTDVSKNELNKNVSHVSHLSPVIYPFFPCTYYFPPTYTLSTS